MRINTVVIGENKYQKYQNSFLKNGVDLHVHQYDDDMSYSSFNNPKRAQSNIERLKIIYEYGGYYVDSDYYLIKIFPNFLQHYDYVFLRQRSGNIINAFFGARKKSQIILNIIAKAESLVDTVKHDECIGSALFSEYAEKAEKVIFVGEDFYSNTKGYLFHDSLRGRLY